MKNSRFHITPYVATAVAVLILAGPLASEGRGSFELWDDAQFTVNSYQNNGTLHDESCATIVSGGSVGNIRALGYSTVNVSGGSVSGLDAWGVNTVNVSAGEVGSVCARHGSTVDISGGSVNRIDAWDQTSTVNISAGEVAAVVAHESTTVDISGGSVSGLYAYDATTVDISGGSVSDVNAYDSSTVNVSGGSASNLIARESSTVILIAREFQLGAGLSLYGDRILGIGVLSGEWCDGTRWAVDIERNDSGATILAIPEPATLSLLALGGLALVRRRKRGMCK